MKRPFQGMNVLHVHWVSANLWQQDYSACTLTYPTSPGRYRNESDMVRCKSCPSGYYRVKMTDINCIQCPARHYCEVRLSDTSITDEKIIKLLVFAILSGFYPEKIPGESRMANYK